MIDMAEMIFEVVGWVGMILVFLAYSFLAKKTINSESKTYRGMNLVGGVSIAINALANNAYPPAILNILWSLIAITDWQKVLENNENECDNHE